MMRSESQLDAIMVIEAGERSHAVSAATLLQCLCIAEQLHVLPPFEEEWELRALPEGFRELAALGGEGQDGRGLE